jgi:TonB family protein
LPFAPLETKSSIPSNLPLESIAQRFVVPRDVSPEAYQTREEPHALPPQPSEMDERITVPLGAASPEIIPPPPAIPTELVEKDIFLTGEVNFLGDEEAARRLNRKNVVERIYSIAVHVAIIALLIWPPKFLRRRQPTPGDMEIARKQMTLLLPPGAFETPRPEPRAVTPAPRVKVDPRVLRQIAPPEPVPQPPPQPVPQPRTPARELPSAPTVQPNASQPPPPSPAPKTEAPANSAPKLETPDAPKTQPNLVLPKSSSNPLRDSLNNLSRQSASGGKSGGFSAPVPRAPAGGGGRLGGGPQGSGMNGAYQILTPTEGVDFSDYMARVLASVKRNWYAVMPESAQLGDRGRVVLEFSIRRNGSVPDADPERLLGSGKEPLDRAAVSAIRSSNPFDHLPPAFSGPEIRLRFIFLYNLPIEAANER